MNADQLAGAGILCGLLAIGLCVLGLYRLLTGHWS